jgi:hypothetical protein
MRHEDRESPRQESKDAQVEQSIVLCSCSSIVLHGSSVISTRRISIGQIDRVLGYEHI